MKLPLIPGFYIMKNKRDEIIYIGKAKALKNRVSQYFGSGKHHPEKVRRMVENVDHFDYILCASEFEALVLECSLIKQHKPKYNILLKDDKGYSYIRISADSWKKISFVMQKTQDGAEYLGPYMSAWSAKNAVEYVTGKCRDSSNIPELKLFSPYRSEKPVLYVDELPGDILSHPVTRSPVIIIAIS